MNTLQSYPQEVPLLQQLTGCCLVEKSRALAIACQRFEDSADKSHGEDEFAVFQRQFEEEILERKMKALMEDVERFVLEMQYSPAAAQLSQHVHLEVSYVRNNNIMLFGLSTMTL